MSHYDEKLRSWQRWSLVVAVVGAAACAAISWDRPANLWRAYLAGYMLCWPVTLGAAGLVAIGNLTGGNWAMAARPAYLATSRTIPLVAILFIPIALSLGQIYPWAYEGDVAHAMSPSKAVWLSPTFFLWRAGGYLAVWLAVIGMLNLVSRGGVPASTPAMRRTGALALVLLAATATFAAFDWAMSLEPTWYSSIYGAIVAAGGVLAAHAVAVRMLAATRGDSESSSHYETEPAAQVYNDLGNLLLAFLMVFGYLSFSQFLIIWSGNLPLEISWYLRRLSGGWQWVALAMVLLCCFAFFQMLSKDRKRTPQSLARIAAVVLVAYCVHTYWFVVPAFNETGAGWLATNVAAMATLAGGWVAAFCWHAGRCLEANHAEIT